MKTFGELNIGEPVYVGVKDNNTYTESEYTVEDIKIVPGIFDECAYIILNKEIPTIGRADYCLNYNNAIWSTIPIDGKYTVIKTFKS